LKKIGLLSDTHGFLDERVLHHFENCDEIWHAGDIGKLEVAEKLAAFKPLKAVFGNIDGPEIRNKFPEDMIFETEGLKCYLLHIAGSPPRYNPAVRNKITANKPGLLVCGHSHLLKVVSDPDHKLLFLNPGAAGQAGFHKMRTIIRFEITNKKIQNMQVVELGKRGKL
jgi:putative phosphoesterase